MQSILESKKIILSFLIISFLYGFIIQNIGLVLPDIVNHPDDAWNVINSVEPWLHFSYFEIGIKRRLFVGSILSLINGDFQRYIFYVLFILILYLFLFYKIYDSKFSLPIIFIIFSFSPLGLQNLAYMYGSFEFILFFIMFLIVKLVDKKYFLLVSVVATISTLIHLISIVIIFPFIIFYTLYIKKNISFDKLVILFIFPSILSIYLIFFGNSDIGAYGDNRHIFEIYDLKNFHALILSIFYLILTFSFYFLIILHLKIKYSNYVFLPLTTVILFVLGVDYMRWNSLIFCICLFYIYIIIKNKKIKIKQIKFSKYLKITSILLCIFQFGPFGINIPYPQFSNFIFFIKSF